MPRRNKNVDLLEGYIKKSRISEKINKIHVDMNRLNDELSKPGWLERAEEVYKKYGIKQYSLDKAGEKQFRLDKLNNSNKDLSNKELEQLWREYQHRDDLIISGQYEDIRAQMYRDNYLKAMRKSGIYPEAIKNVEALSLENWKTIMELPSANKKNPKDTLMPHIGGFHYGSVSATFINNAIEDIKNAFKTLGVEYIDDVDVKAKVKQAIAKVNKVRFDDEIEVANKIDNLIKILPRYNRELISEEKYTEDNLISQQLVVVGANIPRNRVKISKSGNRYIPFVGSTRSGTKNEKIVKALLEGYDIYK